ncbi:PrsW family intramembrane metalloprotease [Saccharicrinis sp. FJH54]|uniref:PrsW family intramembrane metalloprotease n=1 Tax=Saccharicrinis sp. FJH54 TaxID=3344665 RepID=UPI0035D45DC9
MNLQTIAIIALATLIGIAYLLRVRSYDIYEKEPLSKLLLVMFAGGFIAVISSFVFYSFTPVQYNFFDAIFKVGIIEELSKLLALIIVYFAIKKEFNEIVDGLIYITAISLGFAIIENIMYALSYESPFTILFQRSIYAVIGHISFSGYMGIAFYIHKRIHKNYTGIIFSVIVAAFAHGFYDGVLFHHELNFLFRFIFIALVILQFTVLRAALGFSEFRVKLSGESFKTADQTVFLYCNHCDKTIKTKQKEFHGIKTGICDDCGQFAFNTDNVKHLFKYARPVLRYRRYIRKMQKKDRIQYLDDQQSIAYNTHRACLSADMDILGEWLEAENISDRKALLNKPIIGYILKGIGLGSYTKEPDKPKVSIS